MDSALWDKLYLSKLWNGDSSGTNPDCPLPPAKLELGVYPECGPAEPLTALLISQAS